MVYLCGFFFSFVVVFSSLNQGFVEGLDKYEENE